MNPESFGEDIAFPKITSELKQMADIDKDVRDRRQTEGYWDEKIDAQHTERMKQIVADIGWPTKSKVGEQGESNAWLLVQHADHDPDFQTYCLGLMKESPVSEVDPTNIAYLEDRLLLEQGRGQHYGTQFTKIDSQLVPSPIEDEANLEARRAKMGLGPMQEQIDMMYGKYPSAGEATGS